MSFYFFVTILYCANEKEIYMSLMLIFIVSMVGNMTPARVYPNFYLDRRQIRKDHAPGAKNSGIYIFINNSDIFKMYVGQSKNILGRMNNYLNNSYLKAHKNKQPYPKALLKHGTGNFCLIIIEYLPLSMLDDREVFWIALLRPYYNILKGGQQKEKEYFHSKETIEKLKEMAKGRILSEKTKGLISISTSGSNNPFFGLTHKRSTLNLISVANSAGAVYI